MTHYRRSLRLAAPVAAVYAAITTPAGLRAWWTQTCDVGLRAGDHSTFRFGPHRKTMEIETLLPNGEVRWRCTDALIQVAGMKPDEWVGTRIVFRLEPVDAATTMLHFEHVGLVPALECYGICEKGWDQFLGSLQQLVETGQGAPYQDADACQAAALTSSASARGAAPQLRSST
jgi:uncharacterized protein YndB with AHSA1/START domain